MRICFISSFPPNKGNLSEYGFYLINEISKKEKLEIFIIADCAEKRKTGNFKVLRVWKRDSIFIPFKIFSSIHSINPDIVHFNSHMMSWGKSRIVNFIAFLSIPLLRFILRKKVVVTLHNIYEATDPEKLGFKKSFINNLGARIATKFILFADLVVVLVKKYVDILKKNYKAKNVIYMPHGTLGRKLKKPILGKNIILTIGFWRKNKNLPLLIEVFDEIKKVFKKLKLVVVGTSHPNFPGYLEKIKEKYKNRKDIIFTGYLEDKELEKIIKKAALIVLPYTVSTGSSGVVHIVSSFGKPIIMSMLPETEEMIKEEGFYIITVPVNNKEELKRAIIKVLKNKSLQKRIAEKNLKAAEKQSFSKLAEKYIKIYKSLINSS